ncbi:MAG TPA: lectin [Candidatus Binatia bacterium]|nr:lectin [Candidatus Binatia bacterium]
MRNNVAHWIVVSVVAVGLGLFGISPAFADGMGFFVTSAGSGKGADLGGLEGADRICKTMAEAAGSGGKTWRAYLSTQGPGAVNARDRIGAGPWANAKGVVIAKNVAELHGENNLTKQTALTEKGVVVNGRGDTPNMHDILTGSKPDGTAFGNDADMTCANWTTSGKGTAMVGHSDRTGIDESAPAKSWNSSHPSRGPGGGCSQDDLKSTGWAGMLYCFAAD